MRALVAMVAGVCALGVAVPASAGAQPTAAAQRTLQGALGREIQAVGGADGAYVLDLTTGQALYSDAAAVGRLPASVEKLYTTSTALLRFGSGETLTTSVYGRGAFDSRKRWHGTLYLRGGGDPTFGSASFDRSAYGAGATIQRLVANVIHATGITAVRGRVVGDESYFDSLRGTSESGFQFDPFLEGALSALAFNRGLINGGSAYVLHPALFGAQELAATLRAAGVRVPVRTPIGVADTPRGAQLLGQVHSPRMAALIALTNTPSDNFFAEMLLKGLGARFGTGGSTASGAAVVRAELSSKFGIHPRLVDGSGLSRADLTSPFQVVSLLRQMADNSDFVNSLAIGGETGTLQSEMNGTVAQGRCRGKTGTLHDVANLAGYCQALDGHTLAFAFLMNSQGDPDVAHAVEANMAVNVARYDG
ncbi:MAG: D-alanyl-D-alanine carboxypeptidase/D-alanyl-D-alanine-endopeptidase [Solirubrobacterales bacterium]|nr:D-alanyl-D-alanine carboxypeptidase/D-alanyl-D-alanine-endopeptidase [Solirubrobacterales bacterium]